MDQAINHKIHYISRQQRQEILAIARGEAVADYLIENRNTRDCQCVNGYWLCTGAGVSVSETVAIFSMGYQWKVSERVKKVYVQNQ